MSLHHARLGEVIDLAIPESVGSAVASSSLLKSGRLQIMRLVLPSGGSLPEHRVPGEAVIHCLAGDVTLTSTRGEHRLRTGCLVALPANEVHAVHALMDTTLLVTCVRQPASDAA